MEDYPPANIVNDNNSYLTQDKKEEYPIIRCEKCLEIPLLSLDFNKNEIIISCSKEKTIKIFLLKLFLIVSINIRILIVANYEMIKMKHKNTIIAKHVQK